MKDIFYDKEFKYRGLKIDRGTWENAPFPINTIHITDDDMQNIIENLYDLLNKHYGYDEIDIDNYCQNPDSNVHLDMLRWKIEEELFIEYGGIYYEEILK